MSPVTVARGVAVLFVVASTSLAPSQAQVAASEIVLQSWTSEQFYGRWARGWFDADIGGTPTVIMQSTDAGYSSTEVAPVASDNYIDFQFWADAHTRYRLWLRLRATGDSKFNDSVWVQFDHSLNARGQPIYRLGSQSALLVNLEDCSACGLAGWGWQNNAWWRPDTGEVWFDHHGLQTMRVWIREDGVALNTVVLSSARWVDAAPGPVRGDRTSLLNSYDDEAQPAAAINPWPYDGAHGVTPDLRFQSALPFFWIAGEPCIREEFHLSVTPPPPPFSVHQCDRPHVNLGSATKYFWSVTSHGPQGQTFSPVWQFTTLGGPAKNVVLYPTDFQSLLIGAPWQLAADPAGTSGDVRLSPRVFRTVDRGFASTERPPCCSAQRFDVGFYAEPDVPYHLWLRMKAHGNSKWNDSVWVQFSHATIGGAPVYRIGTSDALLVNLENCFECGVDDWGWQDSSWWRRQSAVVTFDGTGPYTLRFWTREDGVHIDQIVLSPAEFLSKRPGTLKRDATVVQRPQ